MALDYDLFVEHPITEDQVLSFIDRLHPMYRVVQPDLPSLGFESVSCVSEISAHMARRVENSVNFVPRSVVSIRIDPERDNDDGLIGVQSAIRLSMVIGRSLSARSFLTMNGDFAVILVSNGNITVDERLRDVIAPGLIGPDACFVSFNW